MRNNRSVRVTLVVLTAGVLSVVQGRSAFAEPPPLDVPSGGVAVGPAAIESIRNRLTYWRGQIAGATNVKEIIEARKGILADYRRSDDPEYQYRFAQEAARVINPLLTEILKENDKLRAVKLVNAGIALSKMPQVTIVPALEVMVAHKTPALRYLGVEGYRAARTDILAQPPDVARQMFRVLGAAAAKEQSAPVIGSLFVTFNISSFAVAAVPPETLRGAQLQALAILRANWPRWCRRVLYGDTEMSRAFEKGAATLQTLSATADRGKILQMLTDLIWCSAKAYDEAGGKGEIGDANRSLLLECERALNAISKKDRTHLRGPLEKEDIGDRGAAVRLGVINWIADLKDFGVIRPAVAPVGTQPASRPATTGAQ